MAMLYQLGVLTFDVMPVNIETTEREMGADYAAKDVIGSLRPREFMGEADDKIRLSGRLFPHKFGGVAGISVLQAMAASGEPQMLIRGDGGVFGWYVIEKVTDKHTFLDIVGVGRVIEFDIELVRTLNRPSAAAMANTILGLFG